MPAMPDWLLPLLQHDQIEWAVFLAAFVSATVLPGGSEVVLLGAITGNPDRFWSFIAIATVGNALGGMTGYAIGRFIPEKKKEGKALAWLHKYGVFALVMTWVPLFGDALPVAAGWLRLNPWACAAMCALGKGLRYVALSSAYLPLIT